MKDKKNINAQNILMMNSLEKLSTNYFVSHIKNPLFSTRVPNLPSITDQTNTSTCWIHAYLYFLKPYINKRSDVKDINFSVQYLYFYDRLECCNKYFSTIIDLITNYRKTKDVKYGRSFTKVIGDLMKKVEKLHNANT